MSKGTDFIGIILVLFSMDKKKSKIALIATAVIVPFLPTTLKASEPPL